MSERKAFTLIELLVVIAIIALLLAVLLPGLRMVKEHAKVVVCSTRLNQIGKAVNMYSDMFNGYLPDDHDTGGGSWYHAYAVYRDSQVLDSGKLKPFRFAYLYELNLIEVPEMFYCPGNKNTLFKYESYSNPAPWGTLPQDWNTLDENGGSHNQWVRIGLTYYPLKSGAKSPEDLASRFINLNPFLPYTTDVVHHLSEDGIAHSYGGKYKLNALFPDGHVISASDQKIFDDDQYTDTIKPWDLLDHIGETKDYYIAYYQIFRAIGQ